MARLYKRKRNGKEYGPFYVEFWDTEFKKVRRRSTKTSTRKEAERILHEIETRHNRIRLGLDPTPISEETESQLGLELDWDTLWMLYSIEYASPQLKAITRKQKKLTWDKFIKYTRRACKNPASLTVGNILVYRSELEERRLNPRSINRIIADLCSIFQWAADRGHIKNNVFKKVKRLKTSVEPIKILTKDKFESFLNHLNDDYKDLLRFQYYTACRISEVLAFTPSWIDGHYIVIPSHIGKGSKGRAIPLHPEAKSIVDRRAIGEDQRIFPMALDSVVKCLQRASVRAETKLTSHDIRRLALTQLVRSNVNLEIVRRIAGHASLNVTRIYLKLATEDLDAAMLTL